MASPLGGIELVGAKCLLGVVVVSRWFAQLPVTVKGFHVPPRVSLSLDDADSVACVSWMGPVIVSPIVLIVGQLAWLKFNKHHVSDSYVLNP